MQWVSPRAIKENFDSARHFGYEWNQPDLEEQSQVTRAEAGDGSLSS
jgi:hypothetical protein